MASRKDEQVRSSRPHSGNGLKNNSLPVFSSKTGTEPGQIISLDDLLQAILDAAPKEKKMYFFKPIPGVDYRAPKLSRGDAGWFVFYYVKYPGTGRLRRIRVKINHVKPTRERERSAKNSAAAFTSARATPNAAGTEPASLIRARPGRLMLFLEAMRVVYHIQRAP